MNTYFSDISGSAFTTSKMAAILVSYWRDSDNETKSHVNPEKVDPDALAHLQQLKSGKTMSLTVLNSAPEVAVKVREIARHVISRLLM